MKNLYQSGIFRFTQYDSMNTLACKTCGTPLLIKATKLSASQLRKQYYYTHYYFCPRCKKMYLNDKFKVTNSNADLFTTHSVTIPVEVKIWTDGACSNNGKINAQASWAFVSGKYEEAGLVEGRQTNNRGEAWAISHALSWAVKKGYKQIQIHTDSQISIHGVSKDPSLVKENRDIFQEIAEVIKQHDLHVEFIKVLGHSGDINNERADSAATRHLGRPLQSS